MKNEQDTEISLRQLSPDKALEAAVALAELNRPEGYYCQARFFETGFGVSVDIDRAIQLFEKAALSGSIRAACYLADGYRTGIWGVIDETKAFSWYLYAAKAGDASAAFSLSSCYLNGLGTEKNQFQAEEWLKKSAKWGSQSAKMALGLVEPNN